MSKKSQSWLDLIKYIFSFWFGKKKEAKKKKQEKQKQVNEELKDKFAEVDKKKEKKKKQDVKKRLDNMF